MISRASVTTANVIKIELIVSDLFLGHSLTNTVDYAFCHRVDLAYLGVIWLLSKPVGKTAKTSFFYFKKSKYGSNSPRMSLIKIADRSASSSTNRITPSPECRASQSLYETIAVSLFARLPPRALLAASPLARDSYSATFPPRIFEQKRDCSQSIQ